MLLHLGQHKPARFIARQCTLQVLGALPKGGRRHYGRISRRFTDLGGGVVILTLHCSRPWVPTLELVHYIIQDGPMGSFLSREEVWFNRKHSSTRMSVERAFGILKARFKEIGTKSSLKLDFLPTVVHCCCVLHNILLPSKDRTLNQILVDCHLPAMNDNIPLHRDEKKFFHPPRPMGLVSEERALIEGQMAREDLLDYLVRVQNTNHNAHQSRRRPTRKQKHV